MCVVLFLVYKLYMWLLEMFVVDFVVLLFCEWLVLELLMLLMYKLKIWLGMKCVGVLFDWMCGDYLWWMGVVG